jgi:hypothetical protein
METGSHLEPGDGWGAGGGEEWARLRSLLELVRREHQQNELSPERRNQIRERLLERLQRIQVRRRRLRSLGAAASAMLLAGLVLTLVIRARAG